MGRVVLVDFRDETLHSVMRGFWLACVFLVMAAGSCAAQKVAITFDDLPLNGDLPPGMTRVDVTRRTLAVLKNRNVPAAYGFVNAKKLEGNADAAEALKLWAGRNRWEIIHTRTWI